MRRIALASAAALTMMAALAAEPTLTPPPNLTVEGIPPIPAALVEVVGRYGAFRSASLLDWHPQRHELLIATRFGDTSQLHLVAMPGGARRQLTFYVDAVGEARFHPHGNYLVFQKDTGGGEWYQLYRYNLSSGEATLLTDGHSRNLMGPFAHDGAQLAYVSTRRTGKDTDLWVMNPGEPASDRLLAELPGGGWAPLSWSADDRQILLLEQVSIQESYLWLVDAASGARTPLTPRRADAQVSYADAAFAAGGRIYVLSDRGSELHHLAAIERSTGEESPVGPQLAGESEDLAVSREGKRVALVENREGQSVLHVLDGAPLRERALPALPPGVLGRLRWHADGHTLGFSLSSAREPGDAYSLDLATRHLERWTRSESAVRTDDFADADLVRWASFDGRQISGFLYRPPPRFSGPRPVLVVIHGGPESQSRPQFLGRLNYYLNEKGVALLFPNVRGSTGFGKTFAAADNGFHRVDAYRDIESLLDWIATRPFLDAQRVAVSGGSYGGHMTLAVATSYPDRIRCAIDVVGMSNLVTFLEHTEAYRRDLRRVEYGDERDPAMRAFLESVAPMNHIDRLSKPLLVIAGANDPRVPVSESEQIVRALKAKGIPVGLLVGQDEGHGFRKKPNQDFQFYATSRFIDEHLLD